MKFFAWFGLIVCIVADISYASESSDKPAENITRPLWELGFGAGGGWIPDYPAAGENSFKGLPFPFVVYRGKIFRVGDRRGILSGRFLNTDKYEFDISVQGAFPVDSDDNEARRGMPDLDWLVGIGPQLKLKLINNPGKNRLTLNLQAAVSIFHRYFIVCKSWLGIQP